MVICILILILWQVLYYLGFPGDSDSNESACNIGDLGSIPGLGRSPGEGNGSPLQYSCLEISRDRGAWQAVVHGVAESWTQLSDFHLYYPEISKNGPILFFTLFYYNYFIHFYFLAMLCSMWDLSSPTRDQTLTPSIGRVLTTGLQPRKSLPFRFFFFFYIFVPLQRACAEDLISCRGPVSCFLVRINSDLDPQGMRCLDFSSVQLLSRVRLFATP